MICAHLENRNHVNKALHCLLWSNGEKALAPHSSPLAWKIPWTEEPGRLQSVGLRRIGHDWATSLSLFTFMHWRRKWQPTPMSLPGESQERWSLVAVYGVAVYGVAQSRTRLRWLSSSSSMVKWRKPQKKNARPCVNQEIHPEREKSGLVQFFQDKKSWKLGRLELASKKDSVLNKSLNEKNK